MFQSIEIDAAVRAAKTRLSMFAGERLRLVILNRGAGASVCVTIADNDQSDPVVELVGSDEIILDSTALTDLAEGADYAFNIWMQDSDGNSLLAYGDLAIRNSIHPVAAWATPEEPLPDPLVLSGTPAASATVGTAYDFQPTVTGGSPAYTFSLTSGTLPDGLSLDSATGQIAGTPTQAEIASGLVLCVTDQDTTEASLPAFGIEVFSPALAAPGNLFTPDQSSLSVTSHLDLRSNWEVVSTTLSSPISGGSPSPGNDVRLSLDTPLIMGRPHFALFDYAVSAGNVKVQLGGDGSVSGKSATVGWANNQFFRAAEVDGNFTRMQLKPTTDFVGTADNLRLYDLSTVDPMTVACDVIIVGGDSNAANATSEQFGVDITAADRQVPYDPRIWYMPCLRVSGSYALTDSLRHVPQPCIEPVATVEAQRMSPVHAVASRLVAYSAARGRPLLVMALGDPGSGLMNTEDWRKSSAVGTTGSRMWNEMVAMKAALDALGPAHEIIGAVWSLGANDQFGGDYEMSHGPAYSGFFSDVRTDIADVPMVLWNIGSHLDSNGDGRSAAMRTFLARFDQDSGDPRSLDRFRVVAPQAGNELSGNQDPHFNANGMQANGFDAGDALLALLS
jgi:hypothetical protein